jgi:hypothetical protein
MPPIIANANITSSFFISGSSFIDIFKNANIQFFSKMIKEICVGNISGAITF